MSLRVRCIRKAIRLGPTSVSLFQDDLIRKRILKNTVMATQSVYNACRLKQRALEMDWGLQT